MASLVRAPRQGSDDGSSSSALDALVQRARVGDRAAFADLVRIHRGEVQRVALRLVGNHEDAEDIAQETFVRAWRGLALHRGDGRFGAWLLGITVHLARDLQRRRGQGPETDAAALLESIDAAPNRSPGDSESRREQQRLVEAAIAALPERLRTALVLRAFEGQPYEEIGRITGVRPATVRTRLVEARRALRRLLGRHVGEGEGGER